MDCLGGDMNYSKISHEHLCEALEQSRGFYHAAKRYIKTKWGYGVDSETIKKRVKEWGMEDWLADIRKGVVEQCLDKTYAKAIENGDNACMFWVLERYGHHIDYLEQKKEVTDSEKGWKVILSNVKADIESNTEEEHS